MLKVSKVLNINGKIVTAVLGGEIKQIKCIDNADILSKFSPWLTAKQISNLKGISKQE